jgi:hypothetical protein
VNKGWRKRAEFYARLASIESLKDLQGWEGLKLEADAKQIGGPWPSRPEDLALYIKRARRLRKLSPLPPQELTREDLTGMQRTAAWVMIHAVHPWTRKWILGLLDKGEVEDLDTDAIPGGTKLVLTNDTARRAPRGKPDPGFPQEEAILDLYWILQREKFPFRRCPVCRSIFVPFKQQRYCTPQCARTALRETRRETRRDYMREYMREYSAKKRKQQKAQGRGIKVLLKRPPEESAGYPA